MADSAYYEHLGGYFADKADLLDERDQTNSIHAYIRRESLATLRRHFRPPGPLLEFGYGTGTEAIELAREGFRIVGLDPSQAMNARAREKAQAAGVGQLCDFRRGSTADTASIVDEFGEGAFQGAFATLGPFNCEPDLKAFAGNLKGALAPGAPLVTLVINRVCAWEAALFLCSGNFPKAFRRFAREWAPLTDAATGTTIPVYYYTPKSFARRFAPHFEVVEFFALPAVLPPPYAGRTLARFGALPQLLEEADRRLARRWPVHSLGDHFEIVVRRTPSP